MRIVLACVCDSHDAFLDRMLNTHLAYDWVWRIALLHSRGGHFDITHPKLVHFSHDFGYGFDRQPEHGGFDEVAARNYLLDALDTLDGTCTILCDGDDIYHPNTVRVVDLLARNNKLAGMLECWHFTTPNQYLFFPGSVFRYQDTSPRLHDPHIRILRHDCRMRWQLNPNTALRETWANRTMHCVPELRNWSTVLRVPGLFHLHTHHMFEPKRTRYITTHNRDWELRQIRNSPLPATILEAYAAQELIHPITHPY